MSQWMDLLRGPALGVIVMIILLAGAILITAFAAVLAQMSLWLRLKPGNASEKRMDRTGSEPGERTHPQEPEVQRTAISRQRAPSEYPRRAQGMADAPIVNEEIDAAWWQAVQER